MAEKGLLEKNLEEDIERWLLEEGGYEKGTQTTYDKGRAIDLDTLIRFLKTTQPKQWERFERKYGNGAKDQLYKTLQGDISRYGLIHTLRTGIDDFGINLKICYFAPASSLNTDLTQKYAQNILQCTRQFAYARDIKNTIDIVLSLNGIPVVGIELKNPFTGQTADNAKVQWMTDRDPKEPIFHFDNRILAYFCCDPYEVAVATRLEGKKTRFNPFNQGSNGPGRVGGAGNPPSENGEYVTSYLWKEVLRRDMLLSILQRYIMRQKEEEISIIIDKHGNEKETKKEKEKIVFPRYHQLDVVEKLVHDTVKDGPGHNYLIQHSAGSGKSNSIAWLTYRLASLHDKDNSNIFNGVFVITDRRVLNRQLQETIHSFEHVKGTVTTISEKDNNASEKLRDAINADKTGIVITTLQRFPIIYQQITSNSGKKYAVIVDEAHSSQSGKSAEKLKAALADTDEALAQMAELEEKTIEELEEEEDRMVFDLVRQGQHNNLCFYAFTATPKPKTLQTFGILAERGSTPDKDRYRAYHIYSMLQAIEEGFIMDVLKNYTTFDISYELTRKSPDNPEYEETPATKALKAFHDNHEDTIAKKTAIMVTQFRNVTLTRMDGRAKAMVVTSSRAHAVRYYLAVKKYCADNGITDVRPMVAFSGTVIYKGEKYTEPAMNTREGHNIPEDRLPLYFASDLYNMLIVADKYQTGYDEPMLHTMFVDKKLKNVKAVQTLSRLNRAHDKKSDTYIFDFVNTADDIKKAFEPFYKGTDLINPVDVNYVYSFRKDIAKFHLWDTEEEDEFYELYSATMTNEGASLEKMTAMLKTVVDRFGEMEEEKRFEARNLIKNFVRFYAYMAQIVRTYDRSLYKAYIFADYLYKVLPKNPRERVDLTQKVSLVFNSIKANETVSIPLSGNVPVKGENPGAGLPPEDDSDLLDNIIDKVNERYRGEFSEADRVMVEGIFNEIRATATKTMKRQIARNDERQFVESQFAEIFNNAAQKCYDSHTDAFRKLFENLDFYKIVMGQMGHAIYEHYREQPVDRSALELGVDTLIGNVTDNPKGNVLQPYDTTGYPARMAAEPEGKYGPEI